MRKNLIRCKPDKAGRRPPEVEASQEDAVAQSFSVGSRKKDSRSYLTDPSAKACRAGLSAMAPRRLSGYGAYETCQVGDQRSKAKHIIK